MLPTESHRARHLKIAITVVFFAISSAIIAFTLSKADDLRLRQEVFVDKEIAEFSRAHVIIAAGEGQFVIAGSSPSSRQAWAVKADDSGGVRWQYRTDFQNRGHSAGAPSFSGAVSMDDGTTFLCGTLQFEDGAQAILTQLDAAGHPLSEHTFLPRNPPAGGTAAYIDDCARSGNYVVTIGTLRTGVLRENAKFWSIHSWYWVNLFDENANLKWEKIIPTDFDFIESSGRLLTLLNGSLIFSAQRGGETELLRLGPTGDLEARRKFAGTFYIARPIIGSGLLRLLGESKAPRPYQSRDSILTMLTLDDHFGDLDQLDARQPINFRIEDAVEMQDRSIIAAGEAFGLYKYGPQITTRFVKFDTSAKQLKYFDFDETKFHDIEFPSLLEPGKLDKEIVAARSVADDDTTRGKSTRVVVDFITLGDRSGKDVR
jgi:hypothetical protein